MAQLNQASDLDSGVIVTAQMQRMRQILSESRTTLSATSTVTGAGGMSDFDAAIAQSLLDFEAAGQVTKVCAALRISFVQLFIYQ